MLAKTICTLCEQHILNQAEISGVKVVDSVNIHYQLCQACYITRPKVNFNMANNKNAEKSKDANDFWQGVIDKAILLQS